MKAGLLALIAVSACAYDADYGSCSIHCTEDTGCPGGLTCAEGLCAGVGLTCEDLSDAGNEGTSDSDTDASENASPNCIALSKICGPTGTDDCCSSTIVPGGTFYRSYDVADVGPDDVPFTNMTFPATISDFRLDTYEVTVGRFRAFVTSGGGTLSHPPVDSGWDPSWSERLTANKAALIAAVKCNAATQDWTDTPSANENLPMNCVTWYEAQAFCLWDGGSLPTDAQWNYAAAGGSEQRAYPWSSPPGSLTIDCQHANYASCEGAAKTVGSKAPAGNGKWGQADIAGNVQEWLYAGAYLPKPCNDCADLSPGPERVLRGGSFAEPETPQRAANLLLVAPTSRFAFAGMRCARPVH